MSIPYRSSGLVSPSVVSADAMYKTIREKGIIPFFVNPIQGYSIEEMTPPQCWFASEENDGVLGPWDWKIDCVQTGDIVYAKFLNGKAAFATPEWYRELLNVRRSLPKYQPDDKQNRVLDYLYQHGTVSIKEIRQLLDVKKSVADNIIGKLMMQCRVITGDIQRVYRGEFLTYNGWQISTFCTPEDYFEDAVLPVCSPEESKQKLIAHVAELSGETEMKKIKKLLSL
ncbi:MAG: hypothetical protein K6A28_03530 [Bacteroidales bacterium]|nr:hypothetical protein [Bacteroidales bacterium]